MVISQLNPYSSAIDLNSNQFGYELTDNYLNQLGRIRGTIQVYFTLETRLNVLVPGTGNFVVCFIFIFFKDSPIRETLLLLPLSTRFHGFPIQYEKA